jgi:hypothetical protein
VADDLAALHTDLNALAASLQGEASREVLTHVGVEARKIADKKSAAAVGSDQRFSGWRTGKIGAGFEFTSDTQITLSARPNGPAVVAEDGRKRGSRRPRRGNRSRVGWGPTVGKHWWSNTVEEIEQKAPEMTADAMTKFLGF